MVPSCRAGKRLEKGEPTPTQGLPVWVLLPCCFQAAAGSLFGMIIKIMQCKAKSPTFPAIEQISALFERNSGPLLSMILDPRGPLFQARPCMGRLARASRGSSQACLHPAYSERALGCQSLRAPFAFYLNHLNHLSPSDRMLSPHCIFLQPHTSWRRNGCTSLPPKCGIFLCLPLRSSEALTSSLHLLSQPCPHKS